MSFLDKLFGDQNAKHINKLKPIVDKINALEDEFVKLSDSQLKDKTQQFKNRLNPPAGGGETLDNILPEAFAAVREASKRTIGQRHFDQQLMGGIILHQGKIAEMKTGEGKTLAATLALYLNALAGESCHLVTVNDYLARRDADWMGPIYDALDLKVAAIGHEISLLYNKQVEEESPMLDVKNLVPISRQEAYAADITYGTNNEFGFDYLRDNMVGSLQQLVQRNLDYAIVDEVDSILIDEARTPLIISAPAEESTSLYQRFAQLVPHLQKDKDYTVDEKIRAVSLTDDGIKNMEQLLGVSNIYETGNISLVHHLEEALKAHALFQKDKDYVIKDNQVIIIDEFTGRMMHGRRYSEGLHQAIEAKEGVEIKRESETLATISFQNYFRLYKKLAGMTGTAKTEEEEFIKIYGLEVASVPTHRPMIREDISDKIYKTEEAKFKAVIDDIAEKNKNGQPILVGTISIEKSEILSKLLRKSGIKHEVLNAKHHEREAKIIAQAGRPGALTVATNMAGRGVDIILGGTPLKNLKDWEKAHQQVLKSGGLYVLGTERHESRRIDNQLRGRSGRQGDQGASQFYVSMDDDLMRIFGGERLKSIMQRLGLPDDMPISHSLISRSIESAQRRVEGHNFDIRKHLLEYDDVQNMHRQTIYGKRRKILQSESIHQDVLDILNDEEKKAYLEKYNKIGPQVFNQLERQIYLRVIDTLWIEHLNTMEQLRQGIGLRGYGQRDPLVEYKQEAYNLFQRLLKAIENEVVSVLMRIEVVPQQVSLLSNNLFQKPISAVGADESMAAGTFENLSVEPTSQAALQGRDPSGSATVREQPQQPFAGKGGVTITVRQKDEQIASTGHKFGHKVGRNEPCPCGAKKSDGRPVKYKHCHGR